MVFEQRLIVNEEIFGQEGVLYLEGDLISATRYEVERILREWRELGIRFVTVHCPKLNQIDSAGLSTLLGALHRYRREEGDLVMAELNPALNAIFEITSMEKYFNIFPTLDAARNHFAKVPSPPGGAAS